MTDLEKGLEIKGDDTITPSGTPIQDAEYRPGLLSTPERRRISDEEKQLRRNGGPSHTDARDPAEPRLDKVVDVQQAPIRDDTVSSASETHETQSLESLRPASNRNDRVSSDSETHEAQSAEPAITRFSLPKVPEFNIATEENEVSRRTREDKRLFDSDCARTRMLNDIDDVDETQGELQENAGGVYVETEEEKDSGGVNNTETDIESQNSRRPYLVLGLLSNSTSIPKEEIIPIRKRTHLFKELHKAASKLRPWPIRILSLKSVSGFAIYECTKQGIHSRVRVDQRTQDILAEMFRAYNSGRRDVHSQWLSFVHQELNNMKSNPRLGTHSLQLILSWSALKLVIWGSTPILLSLLIGFWYMFKSNPGEDPVAIVQTAWGISSYIVTAGAPIAILAAVTQIG